MQQCGTAEVDAKLNQFLKKINILNINILVILENIHGGTNKKIKELTTHFIL